MIEIQITDKIKKYKIIPNMYTVVFENNKGEVGKIYEDSNGIFLEIADIIINSNELLLENSNFILKKEYIFVDEYSEKVKMINVPTVE